ncbi:MAG: hypothetical protein LBH18_07210 [Spirochaetaceae bacterium]|nr:hypothetical protein [Spirochaetaceae bacterium]
MRDGIIKRLLGSLRKAGDSIPDVRRERKTPCGTGLRTRLCAPLPYFSFMFKSIRTPPFERPYCNFGNIFRDAMRVLKPCKDGDGAV